MNVYIPFTARLPSEYQEVEYIQSSGTQYMIIGTSFKTSYKVVIDFQMDVIGGDYVPIGIRYTSGSTDVRYGINPINSYFYVNGGSNTWTTTKAEDKNRHTITLNKNAVTIDGTNYTTNYTNYTFSQGIGLFCYNEYDRTPQYTYKSSNKLYKLDIYDENGNHIHNIVPCYRKSDGVIGMYDLVNNQFYTNSGTGTFSKGNDVNMTELKNAYIGEYKGFEYSYDFRNKSSSQLSTDGWSVFAGRLETGSNGITSNENYDVILMKTGLDLSTASKITISTNIVWSMTNPQGGRAAIFGLINPATQWNNQCVFYVASAAVYNGTRAQLARSGTLMQGTNIGDIGTGTYTPILEIDLVNKTLTGKISGYNNSTYTLTDELVSLIRGLSNMYVYTTQHNYYIQDVSITVE